MTKKRKSSTLSSFLICYTKLETGNIIKQVGILLFYVNCDKYRLNILILWYVKQAYGCTPEDFRCIRNRAKKTLKS